MNNLEAYNKYAESGYPTLSQMNEKFRKNHRFSAGIINRCTTLVGGRSSSPY